MHRSLLFLGVVWTLGVRADGPAGYYRFPALHGSTVVFTAEGDLWKVGVKGGLARRLTSHPGAEGHAAISPDGSTVAFTAEYEGPAEVYTMPIDGGLPKRHTFEGGATVVGWTPRGEILYSTRVFSTLPNDELVRLNPATGDRRRVPLAQASDGVFDPEERTLVFTRLPFQGSSTKRYRGGTVQNLWKLEAEAEEAQPLTASYPGTSKDPMWWRGRVYFLSDRDGIMNLWSMDPRGEDLRQHTRHASLDAKSPSLHRGRIVYQRGADLHLYDVRTGSDEVLAITLATDFDQRRERWVKRPLEFLTSAHLSPNGDRVVLTARGQVFVVPVKAGRLVETPRREGVRYRAGQFLPDGKSVLVQSDETGELEFWKLPANGVGQPVALTREGRIFRFPAAPSPDGQWLAWHDKNQELWVFHVERQEAKRIARSSVEEFSDLAWSPDSQWLAYVEWAANTYRRIHLYGVADGTQVVVTSDRVESYSPAWSPDGKWLYFLSDRNLRTLVPSPWGPRQPEPFFTETTQVFQLALTKGLRSPFRPKDELQVEDEKKAEDKKPSGRDSAASKPPAQAVGEEAQAARGESTAADGAAGGSAAGGSGVTNKPPGVVVKIDLEGLAARIEEVPVPPGNYQRLAAAGKRLYWTTTPTGFDQKRHLQAMEVTAEDPKPKTLVEDMRDYELSLDGKKLLVRKGEAFYVVTAEAGAPAKLDDARVDLGAWTLSLQPREEWRQIFTEAWRMLRDFFYDRDLHGVDWPGILERYRPLVDRVSDRAELNDLLSELAGELAALHIFVRMGDVREAPDQVQPGFLGAELERDAVAGGWRIGKIVQTDPDYPGSRPPLARPGVDVQVGDLLVAINGQPTVPMTHPNEALRGLAGKQVLLEVRSPERDRSRLVMVEPVDAGREAELRYGEWEYTRRQRVEERGEGQIGYVHLRAMGAANMAEWARDFYPVFQRQGLILDVRHNRGGNIDSWILGRLLRKAWFYWQPRVGDPIWNMHYAFRGHLVVLCNERTASDGEAFTEGVRRLGLGKIIGTRTWGGEIWLSAQRWLVDSGMATAAETGVYGPEGEWLIEGHGVDPDVVVDNLPRATFLGGDAQLDAAIAHLRELIAKEPRPVPPAPRYPNKAHPPR